MELPHGKSLVLFDGYCHVCSRFVRFILKFDRKRIFLFAPLTSSVGEFWEERFRLPESVDSVVLIEKDTCLIKSDAILKIARRLGGLFRLFVIFRIIPKSWRDRLYDLIAKNRFRWFGRRESCFLPAKEQQGRFL
jgi:predicted DCC family thiol-disulfide oxidoreductase YuxK